MYRCVNYTLNARNDADYLTFVYLMAESIVKYTDFWRNTYIEYPSFSYVYDSKYCIKKQVFNIKLDLFLVDNVPIVNINNLGTLLQVVRNPRGNVMKEYLSKNMISRLDFDEKGVVLYFIIKYNLALQVIVDRHLDTFKSITRDHPNDQRNVTYFNNYVEPDLINKYDKCNELAYYLSYISSIDKISIVNLLLRRCVSIYMCKLNDTLNRDKINTIHYIKPESDFIVYNNLDVVQDIVFPARDGSLEIISSYMVTDIKYINEAFEYRPKYEKEVCLVRLVSEKLNLWLRNYISIFRLNIYYIFKFVNFYAPNRIRYENSAMHDTVKFTINLNMCANINDFDIQLDACAKLLLSDENVFSNKTLDELTSIFLFNIEARDSCYSPQEVVESEHSWRMTYISKERYVV